MPQSVAVTRSSTQLNSVEPRMAKASIGVNGAGSSASIASDSEAVSLVFEALADIGMTDKEAAYTMALDPAQLSRIKSRQQRLPFDALWRLPDSFWVAFRTRVDSVRGLSAERKRELRAARIGELVKLLVEDVA